jgi:hypothetical protein
MSVKRVTVTFDTSAVRTKVGSAAPQRVLLALSVSFEQFVRKCDGTVVRLFGHEFACDWLELAPYGVLVDESFDAIRDGDALSCVVRLRCAADRDSAAELQALEDDEFQDEDDEDNSNVNQSRFNAAGAARRHGLASPRGDEYQLRQFSSLRRNDRLSDERKRELLGGGGGRGAVHSNFSDRKPPPVTAAPAVSAKRGPQDRSRGLSRSKSLDFEQDLLNLGLDDPNRPIEDAEFEEFMGSFSRAVIPAPKESLAVDSAHACRLAAGESARAHAQSRWRHRLGDWCTAIKATKVVECGASGCYSQTVARSDVGNAGGAAVAASARSPPSQRRMPMLDGMPAPPLVPQLARTVKGNDGPYSCPICFKPYPTAADVQFHQTKRH